MRRAMDVVFGTATSTGGKGQRWWFGRLALKRLFTISVLVLGPIAVGCPGAQDDVDPRSPAALTPHLKAQVNVPRRSPPPAPTVAIINTAGLDYSAMVSQALTAALGPGGIANLVSSGKTVLIKPNLVTSSANAVTDWHVVKALVDLIKGVNGGANIIIGEGSASQDTLSIMTAQGYTAANFGTGVTFANFNDTATNPTNTYVLADSRTGANEQIPALITNADVYIDMPKMKTHYHAGMTGALKNLGIGTGPLPLWNTGGNFGTGGSAKYGLHHDIRSEIVDHVACRVPDLSIMDALQGMEGQGPASGSMVTMNLLLASKDPVALDAVAATVMGIPPYLITHMVLAANENLGVIDLENITTAGNITLAAASAIHTFTRATPGGIQAPVEPGVIPYRATTVIRTAPASMTIDGDLGEWGYANLMTVDSTAQVKSATGWGGAADSSLVALSMYDSQNLYLAMLVRDDHKLVNSNTGAAIVNGDGVELYLSTLPEQYNTAARSYGSTNNYHLAISYATTPQAYMLSHSTAVTGAVISKVDTADGYLIEAKIPWTNFGSPTLTPVALSGGYTEYRQMGINVAVNDADTSASTVDHKLIWNAATDSDIETNAVKTGMSYVDPAGGLYATPTYTLTASGANGSVTKSPDQGSYAANTLVTLTAVPSSGYVFSGWSGALSGTTNPVTVLMNANKTITAGFRIQGVLTSIAVSPTSASVSAHRTSQFTATAYDQFGGALVPQPTFTWTVSGGGTIDSAGLFTAGATAGGPYTVTASSGGISGTASVTVSPSIYQINCGSSSAASPFSGDQYGTGGTSQTITHSIDTSGVTDPAPMAVYQSERYGTSTYTLPNLVANAQYTVRLHFAELYWTTSGKRAFNVSINGTTVLTSFDVFVAAGGQYRAVVREFAATANGSGQIVIVFTTVTNNATISGIEILNRAPTIATAATATPNPVAGTTTTLSVLGSDDGGEANLTYTWATTGTPPAVVSFSANGTNAAKNTTATFSKAGSYDFQVSAADRAGAVATGTVAVTVDQTTTTIAVTPASATIAPLASQSFAAAASDQFGTALAAQPTFGWSVSGGGVIDANGLFTAGNVAGGPFTVTAASGAVSGTASVSIVGDVPGTGGVVGSGGAPGTGGEVGTGGAPGTGGSTGTPCQCTGTGPGDVPVTVDCGQSACGSDHFTYACDATGWTWMGQSCQGNGDGGTACQCTGTGPDNVPVTVDCGQSACGSDHVTYACGASGWTWTGTSCTGNGDGGTGCQCTGTGPGDVPVTVDCGQSACGSDHITYSCSASGWTWTGTSCTGNGDGGTGCQCTGTGPGDVPVTVDCGQSACGSDYVTYACSASGWTQTGPSCTGNGDAGVGCQCIGTGPGGTPVTAACGASACGSDYTTYTCSAAGWAGTGAPCGG